MSAYDAYQEVAAARGVLTFVTAVDIKADQLRKSPNLAWGFQPSMEEQSKVYANYLCTKAVPNPVSASGNPGENGKPRKFGLIYSADPDSGFFRDFKNEVKRLTSKCGLEFAIERTYPFDYLNNNSDSALAAAETVSAFQDAKVTTVVWPLGWESHVSKAAEREGYLPEWIIAGDTFNDGSWPGAYQSQTVWDKHAFMITPVLREIPINVQRICEHSYLEADPNIPREGIDIAQACFFFYGLRQLFIGIQVAGPNLGPSTINRGFRAIPAVASTDPEVPACFYVAGDSTCVKDAQIMRWDRVSGGRDAEISGCWRMVKGGKRFLTDGWPDGNIEAPARSDDPCNGHVAGMPSQT